MTSQKVILQYLTSLWTISQQIAELLPGFWWTSTGSSAAYHFRILEDFGTISGII
jgi:hypothetical protein